MSTDSVAKSKSVQDNASINKPAPSTIRSGPRKRKRQRGLSVDGEIRRTAKQIFEQGMADAMKAAALMIVSRKLDEIKALLMATGVNVAVPNVQMTVPNVPFTQPPAQLAPVVKNPCVQCGREGVYRTKPNQWNRAGSWHCRTHMALAGQIEQEDRMDRAIQPAPPAQPPALQPAAAEWKNAFDQAMRTGAPTPSGDRVPPAPGASSLSEAMGLATVVDEGS